MSNIGNTIKEIRVSKGFSQEELANASLLNLRTIQRIEKNETKPYPKTLALISEALDVNLEEVIVKENKEDRKYFTFLHLSSLAIFLFPLGNIVAPLIFWYVRKESIIGLRKTGANLINFQIMWSIISFIPIILIASMSITDNLNRFGMLVLIHLGMALINVIISVFYAIRANKGYEPLRYPTLLTIVK